jgi:hypothetical protein
MGPDGFSPNPYLRRYPEEPQHLRSTEAVTATIYKSHPAVTGLGHYSRVPAKYPVCCLPLPQSQIVQLIWRCS